ncbi:beta propeller domain protein [Seminavis robusta]|uniref:Beta propeller domain protein n=1 Tax=Seminavis robusta TaxID=568900 RepID=A0A9N8DRA1_9STRA|nr:beta propeller domain protein [Seminavis robusta]|eukprot:Sro314_g115050.1 beta propeller domain protein (974) ;mRNA; f:25327-28248
MKDSSTKEEDHASVEVEEGIANVVPNDDAKSETSEETVPSVESGSNSSVSKAAAESSTESRRRRRRRRYAYAAAIGLMVIVAAIIVGVVVGTCNKEADHQTAASSSSSSNNNKNDKDVPEQEQEQEQDNTVEEIVVVDVVDPEILDMVDEIADPDVSLDLGNGENFPNPFGKIQLPPLMTKEILQPYNTKEEFQADLTLAAENTVNRVIRHNLMRHAHNHHQLDQQPSEQAAVDAAMGVASAAAKQASAAKIKKTSLTNNQEHDADEADLLKNDETYVYAAFGDYLVVWDRRQGTIIAQEKMPDPKTADKNAEEGIDDNNADHDDWYFFFPGGGSFLYIESIQLTESHVLVAVGGMDNYNDYNLGYGEKGTHLRVYTKPTSTNPALTLVATKDIHGYFSEARYLEQTNSVHICTGGDFNTYSLLVEPFDLYHFQFMNKTQYYHAASRKAREELIPKFVQEVSNFFLEANNGQFPRTMKINSWATTAGDDPAAGAPEDVDLSMPIDYGVMDDAYRAFLQVTSIKVDALPTAPLTDTTTDLLSTSAATVIGPSANSKLYATQDSLVLNIDQYHWNSPDEQSTETLHLIHMKVNANDATTTFYGAASLPGSLPNKYAIDIEGTDLRVATTQQHWFPLDQTWDVCGDSWQFDDQCMNEVNWNTCFDTALNCRNVVKTGCPYTFTCQDSGSEPESSTDNLVTVLDISQEGIMTEIGHVEIGEPHEVITAVHFGEAFSYAMTFDQRDPFYVLNLPAGQAPTITGVLKPDDGFSSYLQPLNDDATMLVGIGQNVTGTGREQRSTGLLITVFDVSDMAAPVVLATKMLDSSLDGSSFSDAEFDNRAVQYSNGRLVIPMTVLHTFDASAMMVGDEVPLDATFPPEPTFDESKNFEGFIVLDVGNAATTGIQEILRINHASPSGRNCHYCGGFNNLRRSFLYEDDDILMTVYDNLVISTDIGTGTPKWAFNVTIEGEDNSCCY